MSVKIHLTPSTNSEKQFHVRNASIVKAQKEVCEGSKFSYLEMKEHVLEIEYMRARQMRWNLKYGLHKEIA